MAQQTALSVMATPGRVQGFVAKTAVTVTEPYQIETGHAYISGGDVGQGYVSGGDVGQENG